MSDYQGWTNSATFLANQYIQQEPSLHQAIVALYKTRCLTSTTLKELAPVVVNSDEDADCGYVKGVVRLDTWAEGEINWDEMVETWNAELTPRDRTSAI